jgi:hypothetical protein
MDMIAGAVGFRRLKSGLATQSAIQFRLNPDDDVARPSGRGSGLEKCEEQERTAEGRRPKTVKVGVERMIAT